MIRTKDLKLRTGSKAPMTTRGPLKALPNPGPGSNPVAANDSPVNNVFKRLHWSNSTMSSNSSMSVEDGSQALYDEYLISCLTLHNVRKNCQEGKKQANKELLELWTALESIRNEVHIIVITIFM